MVSKTLQKLVGFLRLSELAPLEDTQIKASDIESSIAKTLERTATLLLFPDTIKSSFWLAQEKCSHELQHITINLAPETCLSGDYELASNVMITSMPRCPSGHTPAMMLYDMKNCRGKSMFQSTSPNDIPLDTCLQYQKAKNWSLIFRCSLWPELAEGAEKHETAIPPHGPEDPRENGKSRGKSGLVLKYVAADCGSDEVLKPEIAGVDKCIQTTGDGFKISMPAICPSGKRAKIARFTDSNCDSPLENNPVIKLYNSEVDKCLETRSSVINAEKINSVSFHCQGIETQLESLKNQGQIYTDASPPACHNHKYPRYQSPKTVSIDTCVQVDSSKVQINRRPACPDGTHARFARFADDACEIAMLRDFLF